MNAAHYHIVLTHIPLMGIVSGFCLILAGIAINNTTLKKSALCFFIVSAIIAVSVYLTGEKAMMVLTRFDPTIPMEPIEQHEEMAALALGASSILGFVSLVFVIIFRGERQFKNGFALIITVLSLIAIALTGYTANLGGKIRHPEIHTSHH